jgi:hypothetical protein
MIKRPVQINQDNKLTPEKSTFNKWIFLCLLITGIMSAQAGGYSFAQTPYPSNLWQGLIAEDVSGGYQGMYAVACCVRNRLNIGMNTGLVALKRKDLNVFVERQGRKYELMAKDIIRQVFEENAQDVTRGATHYENIERYGLPKWAKGMVRTTKIGEHTYFKEKGR